MSLRCNFQNRRSDVSYGDRVQRGIAIRLDIEYELPMAETQEVLFLHVLASMQMDEVQSEGVPLIIVCQVLSTQLMEKVAA